MATVKSFSYSDKNEAVSKWVKAQKSLSQSLEIAIKLAITQYGICDLTEKRDQLFAGLGNSPAPAVSAPEITQSAPAYQPQQDEPRDEAVDQSDRFNKTDHVQKTEPADQTQPKTLPNNDQADDNSVDLSFLDLGK